MSVFCRKLLQNAVISQLLELGSEKVLTYCDTKMALRPYITIPLKVFIWHSVYFIVLLSLLYELVNAKISGLLIQTSVRIFYSNMFEKL